ncbi:uncharacterized protein C2845_PM02G14230 [Panicum miliaceum]|uniref:Uncharacterized protein n=1 Tax=Panicum miliaceum TaxID=4540 RepID=A0A3L6S9B5_PANMI|nr:uncharacterized protein C2845_PM02G14230 [Panicum miliaceum]
MVGDGTSYGVATHDDVPICNDDDDIAGIDDDYDPDSSSRNILSKRKKNPWKRWGKPVKARSLKSLLDAFSSIASDGPSRAIPSPALLFVHVCRWSEASELRPRVSREGRCRADARAHGRGAAAAAAVLVLVMGAGLPGCAAQEGKEEVVVASYGQGRLWLKPYDWAYLRVELLPSFSSVTMDFATDMDIQREHMKGIPRSELAIICLMNSNPPIPDITESYLDSLWHIWQSVFLIASNAAGILPAFWTLRQKAFAEWILYTSSGISSALYHSCDVGTWCILSFRVLQFLDFWLSFMAVVGTFICMATIDEASKRAMHTTVFILTALLAATGATSWPNFGTLVRNTLEVLNKRFRWIFLLLGFITLSFAATSWKLESNSNYWIWHSHQLASSWTMTGTNATVKRGIENPKLRLPNMYTTEHKVVDGFWLRAQRTEHNCSPKLSIKLIDLLSFNIVGSCFLGIIRELFSMWHITICTSSFFFLCSMRVNARNRSPESNYELTRQDSLPRSEPRET